MSLRPVCILETLSNDTPRSAATRKSAPWSVREPAPTLRFFSSIKSLTCSGFSSGRCRKRISSIPLKSWDDDKLAMNLQSERTIAIHLPIYLKRDVSDRKIFVHSFVCEKYLFL